MLSSSSRQGLSVVDDEVAFVELAELAEPSDEASLDSNIQVFGTL